MPSGLTTRTSPPSVVASRRTTVWARTGRSSRSDRFDAASSRRCCCWPSSTVWNPPLTTRLTTRPVIRRTPEDDRPEDEPQADAERQAARVGRAHAVVPRRHQPVAHLRDGLDQPRVRGVVAELAPQVRDVDVDDPVVDVVRSPRDRIEQLLAGQDRAGVAGERAQQADLARGEPAGDRAVARVEREAAADLVDRHAPGREGQDPRRDRARARPVRAPQDGRDPRRQLVRVERLGEVVVGAHPQAGDPLGVGALRRGDEDRDVGRGPDRLEDRLAAEPGQHQVEDDEVDRRGVDGVDRLDRGTAVADHRDGVAVPLEVEAQQVAKARFVLDDQDVGACRHGRHPSRPHVQES